MVREGDKMHLSIYLAILLEYEKIYDYNYMRETGEEVFEISSPDLKARGESAFRTAQVTSFAADTSLVENCWYEVFHSSSTTTNYLLNIPLSGIFSR